MIGSGDGDARQLAYASVGELARLLARGELTSVELVRFLHTRIESLDVGGVNSVLALDEDALDHAARADAERRSGAVDSPLHGIPLLVKDNIETAGRTGATAGSLALVNAPTTEDAPAVARLRDAGALVLGKANLSEWANFRSRRSCSGWSGVGGQTRNPHVLDRSASGSSSGSAAAVAAGFAPLALGTETDGSIVCPASACGVVGMKPTFGVVPGAGVVPLATSQDTVGPMGRCVGDVALLLDYLTGRGSDALFTSAATRTRLDGVRVGVARVLYTGNHAGADACFELALAALRDLGAVLIDPADIPTAYEMAAFEDEFLVLACELADDLGGYLARRNAGRSDLPRSLVELIEFNESHHDGELSLFGQEIFEFAMTTKGREHPSFAGAFARQKERARGRGLDAALDEAQADVLVTLTAGPARPIDQVNGDPRMPVSSSPAAVAGYPALTLPIGLVRSLPVGMSIVGRAHHDTLVVGIAAALEGVLGIGARPAFVSSVDTQ